jgi:hypothetical protein
MPAWSSNKRPEDQQQQQQQQQTEQFQQVQLNTNHNHNRVAVLSSPCTTLCSVNKSSEIFGSRIPA